MMTPNDLEILIHFNCSGEPHPRRSAPAVKDSIKMLEMLNLIEGRTDESYNTTERGKCYMKLLCNLPLPEKVWLDKDGKEIKL